MDSRTVTIDTRPALGKHVLVALSGGADSVALLLLLLDAGIRVSAAHFEHGLRAEESVRDMEFCRTLCAEHGVPFLCARGDVNGSRLPGEGVEAAARRLRYDFLRRALRASGADLLATAHHADDQAETLLMHLFRGAGSDGLCGMRAYQEEEKLYRPLLQVRKSELVRYLCDRGASWREDATNACGDTPRNALRLHVLPEVEKIYPGAVNALVRFGEIQAVQAEYLRDQMRAWQRHGAISTPDGEIFHLNPPPHRAILALCVREALGVGLPYRHAKAVLDLAESPGNAKISLPEGRYAERIGDELFLTLRRAPRPQPVPFVPGGEICLPGLATFHARPAPGAACKDEPLRQVLSGDALEGAECRVRREGDWIRPLGTDGRKSLSDYMTDRKFPRPLRDWVPLVARGREILWAVGLGISENCAVTADTRAVAITCNFSADFLKHFFGGTKA